MNDPRRAPGRGSEGDEIEVEVYLNGVRQSRVVPSDRLLIHLLRDDLGAIGTKEGCSVGVCGACSVLVDGVLLSSCLVFAARVDGCHVQTVEGLASDAKLSLLQSSFVEHGGVQCGYCTPGQLVAATALLSETSQPSDREIAAFMKGNLCRCTGYFGIARAIRSASGLSPEVEGVRRAFRPGDADTP